MYIHIYIYIYITFNICTHTHICIYMPTYSHMHTHTHTHIPQGWSVCWNCHQFGGWIQNPYPAANCRANMNSIPPTRGPPVTWLIHTCEMKHSNVSHGHTRMWNMTFPYVRHESNMNSMTLTRASRLCVFLCVIWHMGWLRSVGSIKWGLFCRIASLL